MTAPAAAASLAARLAALPAALRWTATVPHPALPAGARRIVATGVGSSEAHARLLCHALVEAGRDARWVPLSAIASDGPAEPDTVLVVVSQGLPPNARLVLGRRARFGACVLLTATRDDDADPAKRGLLGELAAGGASVVRFAGADEYGTLLRVTGPRCGYVAAWRAARALAGGSSALDAAATGEIVASAAAAAPPALDAAAFAGPLAFVVTGTYGELTANLRYKVLEGLFAPPPPVWDALHLAHGPFQQAFAAPATFVALARADAGAEEERLLARFETMLVPGRHRLVRLPAALPGPLAILAHEAALDAAVVAEIARRGIDQAAWPARGHDAPLYALEAEEEPVLRLADATWPEVEAAVAAGRRAAVVALGSTEQHGPHLPLATDTLIGDALAARLVARVGDAVQGPTLSLGCASEHLAFPGTLHVRAETLAATLADVVRSLARHGITRVFVFSAHGGNYAALADALPALRAVAAGVAVDACTDLAAVTAACHDAAAAAGVAPAVAGHHAGEVETSILLALHPGLVRRARLAAGHTAPVADPQALFYPSLRAHAPDGTVGDPRDADAGRGRIYLEAWVDVLADAYRGETKSARKTGTEKT
jgi:creatinine amidohydrolase